MALFPKNDPTTVAQQVLAHFLQKPAQNINCTLLTGGSEEDKVLWCLAAERRNGSARTDKLPGTEYIIKLFNRQKCGTDEIAWTRLASDLGIGPQFYDTDPAGTYMITAVAQGAPLTPVVANTPSVVQNIAKSLATLHHADAPFATGSDMYERINAKYARLETWDALQEVLKQALQQASTIKEHLSSYATQPAACHNDLNPGNIFVHNDQVTLIDWGDATLGNPYYDIAAFLVLNVINPEYEKIFLAKYDAALLNDPLHKDLQLYKQLVYFEFALNLLGGLHVKQNPLLHAQQIPSVEHVSYYLTLLAKREVTIDENFLYAMAIASLHEMLSRK